VLTIDFEHIVQSHYNTCLLVSVYDYKPCHIPLQCRCPVKKRDYTISPLLEVILGGVEDLV
jgi:hypothetical protein